MLVPSSSISLNKHPFITIPYQSHEVKITKCTTSIEEPMPAISSIDFEYHNHKLLVDWISVLKIKKD